MRFGYEFLGADSDANPGVSGSGGAATSPLPLSDAASGGGDPDVGTADPLDAGPSGAPDAAIAFDAASADAGGVVACQSFAAFSAPQRLVFGSSGEAWGPGPSADNATLFVGLVVGSDENVARATRPDRGITFGALSNVANVNSGARDGTPFITANGLSLYFFSERFGGQGQRDLMLATRTDPAGAFSAPSFLTALNSSAIDHEPRLSADELSLVFESTRGGGAGGPDMWLAERSATSDAFVSPRNVSELNTSASETGPALSADALTLMFASDRPGGTGGTDIWRATRPDRATPFANVERVSELNSSSFEYDVALSADQNEVFFVSTRLGAPTLWRALRVCLD